MADQEWSNLNVAFTMIPCALESLETLIIFAIWAHMGIKSNVGAELSKLESTCEYQVCNVQNTKVKAAEKDHGKNLHVG